MKIVVSTLGISVVLILCSMPWIKPADAHTRITTDINWSENIREILRKKCMNCHHPGGIAPDYVNLTIYGDDVNPGARAWAISIQDMIMTNRMPPWPADHRFGEFSNARQLTDEEVAFINFWIDGGAPQGPYRDLPMPEEFEKPDWEFGEPDLVIALPEPHILPADTWQDTATARVSIDIEEDTWITGYEFFPQNPESVYSMTALIHDPEGLEPQFIEVELQVEFDAFADEDEREQTRMREMPQGPHMLGQWIRGDKPVLLPNDAGRKLRAGSSIELRIVYSRPPNYADGSIEIIDNSKLGLFVAGEGEEIDLLVESKTMENSEFTVSANDANYEATVSMTFDENVHLIGINPHVGLLGKNLEARITYPDDMSQTLLLIPQFDTWNWTGSFVLERPISAPAGSVLELTAHYDNSEDNWNNPNSPPQDLHADSSGRDAMLYAIIDYTLDDHLQLTPDYAAQLAEAPASSGEGMLGGGLDTDASDPKESGGLTAQPDEDGLSSLTTILETLQAMTDEDVYWCPMRGDFCPIHDFDGPGKCDNCGMALKPKLSFFEGMSTAIRDTSWDLTSVGTEIMFWCPNRGRDDHELLDYTDAGTCEVCGETLSHKAQFEFMKTYTCVTPECELKGTMFYSSGLCPHCGQPVTGMGHMNHTPLHGGQFFMADNLFHHIEGILPVEGDFRLHFYDDWKRPLDPRNFKGQLIVEQEDESTGDVTEIVYEITHATDDDPYLSSAIPPDLPAIFYVKVWLAGEEKRFDFEFEELTVEPDPSELTGPVRLHAHEYVPITIPEDRLDVVREILTRQNTISDLIDNKDWFNLHQPAFAAKDLIRALEEKQDGLNVRQRGALKKAISAVFRAAEALDRAGDALDEPRAIRANTAFNEGIAILGEVFPEGFQQ